MKIKNLDKLAEKVDQCHGILDEIEQFETVSMIASKSAIIVTIINPDTTIVLDDLFTADEIKVKIVERIKELRAEFKSI